jgi:outer membrane protein TolC
MKKTLSLILLALLCIKTFGQVNTFTITDLYKNVVLNHPLIKQANLVQDAADWDLRIARGGFDPVFATEYSNKIFSPDGGKQKLYWDQIYTGFKIPTWFGADINLNYQNAVGSNLDNELAVPAGGLYTAGISLPVGQGLLIDSRRAALRQAQLYLTIAGAERQKLVNKTLIIITKDYWDWYYAYKKLEYTKKVYSLAKDRYLFIADNVKHGEEAPIDSVEAHFNYLQREQLYLQADVDFKNAGINLSTHLWRDGTTPLEIDTTLFPSDIGTEADTLLALRMSHLIDSATNTHPDIVKLDFKLQQLGIDKRLSIENLKPRINLNYNFLSSNNFANNGFGPIFRNNYKSGVEVYFPLLLRKERGKLNLIKNKITQTNLELDYTIRDNKNNLLVAFNDLLLYEKLVKTQVSLVNNLQQLYDAELLRFSNGESTLFVINLRETNLISGQIKLAELKAKYAVAKANIKWIAGLRRWQ